MYDLKKVAPSTYILPKEGGMLVPGLLIASEEMLREESLDEPLKQVRNVAYLPGIVNYSIAMPDIHWGYGFPIGGVAAMDIESGVISPGGVGYDINCGVRLALAPFPFATLSPRQQEELLHNIFRLLPAGVGREHKERAALLPLEYEQLTSEGASWSVAQGYGFKEDLEHTESHGCLEGADISCVSQAAKHRGSRQLGSIGSGNHFVEIGAVEKIHLPDVAKAWDISEGQTYILIHSGSRGFGHQICQDTLDLFIQQGLGHDLPDKQLIAAPITSDLGKHYFKAMAAAANFAFNNRQQILHLVRQGFANTLQINPKEIRLLYDVCHNIAKFEEHLVNGKKKKLCVHRKGATRAFGPHAPELAPIFQSTGQPVLVPGDMGRASYLMVGEGNPITWCSACHGAGRARSRIQSFKHWQGKDLKAYFESQGVKYRAASHRTVAEEMPDAYKDVHIVVTAVEEAHLAKRVASMDPRLVIKG